MVPSISQNAYYQGYRIKNIKIEISFIIITFLYISTLRTVSVKNMLI